MREAADDDARTDDPVPTGDPGVPGVPDDGGEAPVPRRTGRRWLRWLGVGMVVVLALVAIGFQVQVQRTRDQVDRAEVSQQRAELDEQTAKIRLASVNDRLRIAREQQNAAAAELARARADMTAQGLEEAALPDVQAQTAAQVRELRSQEQALAKAIAKQKELQPAAGACVFDLLQALSRAGSGHSGGTPTEACAKAAG